MPRHAQPAEPAITEGLATPGKYLTFRLSKETYGLEILKVQEIVGLMPITRVPHMPPSVRGVVNLRGRVIPVIDLRVRFGSGEVVDTDVTCIIIVRVAFQDRTCTMGILVDEVWEVVDLPESAMSATPAFGGDIDTRFLTGIGTMEQGVVLLLDIDRVLSESEVAAIEGAAGHA